MENGMMRNREKEGKARERRREDWLSQHWKSLERQQGGGSEQNMREEEEDSWVNKNNTSGATISFVTEGMEKGVCGSGCLDVRLILDIFFAMILR